MEDTDRERWRNTTHFSKHSRGDLSIAMRGEEEQFQYLQRNKSQDMGDL